MTVNVEEQSSGPSIQNRCINIYVYNYAGRYKVIVYLNCLSIFTPLGKCRNGKKNLFKCKKISDFGFYKCAADMHVTISSGLTGKAHAAKYKPYKISNPLSDNTFYQALNCRANIIVLKQRKFSS